MKKVKHQKSAASGTKAEGSVGLGSESIAHTDNKVQYPLSDSAKELLTKLDEYFNVRILETCFQVFTPDDQDEIVKWAGEIAYEPRINQLLVPDNEHEKRLFEMFTTVGRYIAEYEESKNNEQENE